MRRPRTMCASCGTILPAAFPESVFYFQSADIVTQILNFGLPAQIDVRTVGYDRETNLRVAQELRRRIAAVPGIVDAHLQQEVDAPAFFVDDRPRARGLARAQCEHHRQQHQHQPELVRAGDAEFLDRSGVGNTLLLRGADARTPGRLAQRSRQHAGVDVARLDTDGASTPVPGLLGNVATFRRDSVPTNANQTNIQPVYEVYASVQGRDLGRVSAQIDKIVADLSRQLKPGNSIQVAGPDPEHERRLPQSRRSA